MKVSYPIFLGILIGLSTFNSGYAETIRGKIITSKQLSLEYVYETTSNSFALEADGLVHPKITTMNYTPVPKEKCDTIRNYFKTDTGGLDADTLQRFFPSSPLNLSIQVTQPIHNPEYATLVQADLKKQGMSVYLPKNVTRLDRILLQLGFHWNNMALSVLGENNLKAKAQQGLLNTWTIHEDDSGFQAVANTNQGLASMICDLQEKNLSFVAIYEFQNIFSYSDRGNIQPNLLLNLWKQLTQKGSQIDQIAAQSDVLSARDARLVAAGSLLTLEIMNSAPKTDLLKPEKFIKTFNSVFNTPTIEVSRFFNEKTAEDLADWIGQRNEIKLNTVKGNVDL